MVGGIEQDELHVEADLFGQPVEAVLGQKEV